MTQSSQHTASGGIQRELFGRYASVSSALDGRVGEPPIRVALLKHPERSTWR